MALREGDMPEIDVHGLGRLKPVERKREDDDRPDLYKVRTVLSPRDEAIDLTTAQYDLAMAATRRVREASGKGEPKLPGGVQIRAVRPATRGLLLLYPLAPPAGVETELPIFAPVVSFPDSPNARSIRVIANTVFQRQEFVG